MKASGGEGEGPDIRKVGDTLPNLSVSWVFIPRK